MTDLNHVTRSGRVFKAANPQELFNLNESDVLPGIIGKKCLQQESQMKKREYEKRFQQLPLKSNMLASKQ